MPLLTELRRASGSPACCAASADNLRWLSWQAPDLKQRTAAHIRCTAMSAGWPGTIDVGLANGLPAETEQAGTCAGGP